MSRAGRGPGPGPKRRQGRESWVLRSLSKGLGIWWATEGAGEESVTLPPGLPRCSPLRPYFLQAPQSSGFCPAEPSHVSVHGCVLA